MEACQGNVTKIGACIRQSTADTKSVVEEEELETPGEDAAAFLKERGALIVVPFRLPLETVTVTEFRTM